MLIHNVYFTLKDNSDEARQHLIDECYEYLSGISEINFFHSGVITEKNKRPVNDRDFDVGLHVIFESQEAHDNYQASEPHKEFVNRNRDNWADARVFDTTAADSKS
jgi:heme-degrading monooxygenase HmoA